VLVFFGCLEGLHRQLVTARRHYLEWAGELYARACEPVRSGSLEALGQQARALEAAEVIHRRAEAIQQWPFQQRRLAQIAAIVGTWSASACRPMAGRRQPARRTKASASTLGRSGVPAATTTFSECVPSPVQRRW
jgi:hypothetical protein